MITKQQLDDVYKEVQQLEKIWLMNRKKGQAIKYSISHRLLGLFLVNFKELK